MFKFIKDQIARCTRQLGYLWSGIYLAIFSFIFKLDFVKTYANNFTQAVYDFLFAKKTEGFWGSLTKQLDVLNPTGYEATRNGWIGPLAWPLRVLIAVGGVFGFHFLRHWLSERIEQIRRQSRDEVQATTSFPPSVAGADLRPSAQASHDSVEIQEDPPLQRSFVLDQQAMATVLTDLLEREFERRRIHQSASSHDLTDPDSEGGATDPSAASERATALSPGAVSPVPLGTLFSPVAVPPLQLGTLLSPVAVPPLQLGSLVRVPSAPPSSRQVVSLRPADQELDAALLTDPRRASSSGASPQGPTTKLTRTRPARVGSSPAATHVAAAVAARTSVHSEGRLSPSDTAMSPASTSPTPSSPGDNPLSSPRLQ